MNELKGQVLKQGLLKGWELVGVAGLWRWRLLSTMNWQRLGDLWKVSESSFVRRSWVDGSKKRMCKHSLRIQFKPMEVWIINGGKIKVVGFMGGYDSGDVGSKTAISGEGRGVDIHRRRRF